MEWIPVKENLPNDRQEVLTYWAEKRQIQLQTYFQDGPAAMSWWLGGWQNLVVSEGNVTHWMPLPEIPRD